MHITQYMSAIFYHNEEQLQLANQTKDEHQKSVHRPIQTKIKPFESFYNAENYHQKYLLRNQRKLFTLLNLTDAELIDNTLAAKLNGYVGGFGSLTNLNKDLEESQLPKDMIESVKAHVAKKSS
uniref:peptide-methionine (S)-S-oxide reductase n=1 Tax=Salmonella sp. s51228 TaxID=3159652 RepID=UPI0039801AA1